MDDNNRLLTGLIVVSLLLHGLLNFFLPGVYRPQRTSFIELTIEEIRCLDHHAPPGAPVLKKRKKSNRCAAKNPEAGAA